MRYNKVFNYVLNSKEMQSLIDHSNFEKDKVYVQQFERIQFYKKRLELLNSKMNKI